MVSLTKLYGTNEQKHKKGTWLWLQLKLTVKKLWNKTLLPPKWEEHGKNMLRCKYFVEQTLLQDSKCFSGACYAQTDHTRTGILNA